MGLARYFKRKQIIRCRPDHFQAFALEKAALKQIESIKELPADLLLVNAYSAMRKILEAITLKEGLKFYSHEAYTEYLKEKDMHQIAQRFNHYRKIRNRIEYEGSTISKETAQTAHEEMKEIIAHLLRG